MTSQELLKTVPIHKNEYFTYVRNSDIPKEYKNEFDEWMYGQTMPLIEGEGPCSYSWDFERWVYLALDDVPTYFD